MTYYAADLQHFQDFMAQLALTVFRVSFNNILVQERQMDTNRPGYAEYTN